MSNEKQTAVDWLVSQQKHNQLFSIETIEQAKEMEKEQIEDACWAGGNDGKQYYKETYVGKK
jgi:hypothetical protein